MVTNFYVNQGQYTTKHILTHAFLIIYITGQLTSLSLTQSIVNHSCYVYTILTYKPAASPSAFRHKGVGHVSKLQGTPSVCLNQTVVRLPPRRRRHTLTSTHLHPRTYRPLLSSVPFIRHATAIRITFPFLIYSLCNPRTVHKG